MPTYKKHFNNKFVLNGVELENVSIGVSVIGKFEEPLDEAGIHLPFTIRDYEYPMRGLLQIYSEDFLGNLIENSYIILSDEVEEGSKYGEWKHNLMVMEYSGKYDSYLYHTFTYTKPLKNNNPAPFQILSNVNGEGVSGFNYVVRLEPINIKTTYFNDEVITIPKVYEAVQGTSFVAPYYHLFSEVPAFIKIDNQPIHYLSSSPYTFTLPEGKHTIDYGFVAVASQTVPVAGPNIMYRFYVNSIKRNNLSLLDALNIIRDSKPFECQRYHTQTRLFNIDPNIEQYLSKVEMPQMFLQKATMRQILNTLFSYVNAISRFYYNFNDIDTLSMDEFNKVIGSFDIEDVIGYGSKQDAVGLFNQGFSWSERVLPSSFEEETLTTPSENLYKTVRSTQVQLVDTKFGFELETELYQPTEFKYLMNSLQIQSPVTPSNHITYTNFPLDLTTRFINKEEWLLKNYTLDFPTPVIQPFFGQNVGLRENRVSNLYWQQGSKTIELSEVQGEVLQTNLVISTINEALKEFLTRNMIPPEYKFDSASGSNLLVTRYNIVSDILTGNAYRDLRFQLKYISFESFPFQTHRENTTNSLYYTEGRLNQNDKALNISFASMRAYGDTQRSGVPSISFSKIYEDYSNILRWGMKDTNDFIIVEEKFEYHNEFMKATYTATKDHNRLSMWTKVDQEYRWSEIPKTNQVFERQELFNENIVIYDPSIIPHEEQTMISDIAVSTIFRTLINGLDLSKNDGKTKVTMAYVRTDGFSKIYPDTLLHRNLLLTPVRSFGGRHGFSFIFGFEGNQVALNQIEEVSVSGSLNYFNKAVRYTDENGEFTKMWFALSTIFLNDDYNNDDFTEEERMRNYPLSRTKGEDLISSDFITHKSGHLDNSKTEHNPLLFGKKDKSQSIKVAIQTSILLNNHNEYVLGLPFFTENFIVNNPEKEFDTIVGTPMYLYQYTNGTKYNNFDAYKIKSGHTTPILLVDGSNVHFFNKQLRFFSPISMTNVTSWAIGDKLGNLYIACNFGYNGFNVGRKHFYPNQEEIGGGKYETSLNFNLNETLNVQDNIFLTYFKFPTVSLSDEIIINSFISEIQSTDFVTSLLEQIEMTSSLEIIKSTDYEVLLLEPLTIYDDWNETEFIFPTTSFDDLIVLNSFISEDKSEDFVLSINDNIIIDSTLTFYVSTDYKFPLLESITTLDNWQESQFIFPTMTFSDLIEISSLIENTKSTNYEVSSLDSLSMFDDWNESQFVFPITSFSDLIEISSFVGEIKSTDYLVDIFGANGDFIVVDDTYEIIQSTNYELLFSESLPTLDNWNESQFVFPITSFNDQIELTSLIDFTKSTNYSIDLIASNGESIIIDDIIEIIQSTNYQKEIISSLDILDNWNESQFVFPIASFDDSIEITSFISETKSTNFLIDVSGANGDFVIVEDSFQVVQSTNYELLFSEQLSVLDNWNESKFIFYSTSFSDIITLTSEIQSYPPPNFWNLTSTTSTSPSVNYLTGDTSCRNAEDVEIWLTTNYPPQNYTSGTIIRVRVITSESTLCATYYFEAIYL